MSGPTPDELERLKRELKDASLRERRPAGSRARGLEKLMDEEAAAPPSTSGSKRPAVIGATLVVAALLVAWGLSNSGPAAVEPPRIVKAASAPVVVATTVDAGPAVQAEPVAVIDAGAPVVLEAQVATVDAGRASKPVRAPVEDPDLLARELSLLDRARSTLRTDPKQTLLTLNEYLSKYPSGALRSEAALIRVEALLAVGRVADAQRLANQLIAADQDGLIKQRLIRLLDAGQ
jgi:hypothetical protein